jgi:hypothetical protein
LETLIERHAAKLKINRLPFHNRACLREQAVVGLVLLSPLPAYASNRVCQLTMSSDTNVAWAARWVVTEDLHRKVHELIERLGGFQSP